jgi:NADPH:quinone reductase-like Zn-dependent oxidoreductase
MVGPGVTPELVGATVLVDPLLRDFRGLRAGVLGENVWGGLAEYVVVPAANVIRIDAVEPERLHVFAALPIGYGTAHRMLFTRAKLEAGETVLVLAATGGVGVACVQLARLHGARVIACSSSASKLDQLKALGADAVIDTSLGDFVARVKELTEGRGADVVIDYIGRDTWQQSILVTKRASLGSREAGRIVTCGASSGFEASTDLRYVWTRELNILGSNAWRRDDLETLIEMVDREELHPIIDSVFSLSRAGDALRRLEARAAFGKVIVVPNEVILS